MAQQDPPNSAPLRFGSGLKRLGTESLIYGLSSIIGRLLSYLLQPYYAHHFDPAQNGVQSVVYSYIPIISIALYLGMDIAYMKAAAGVENDSQPARQRAFSMSFGMVAAIGGAVTIGAATAAPLLAPVAALSTTTFRYMLAIVYTDALLAVPYAHLRMTRRSMKYAMLRLLFVGISVALNVALIGRFNWGIEAIFLPISRRICVCSRSSSARLAGIFGLPFCATRHGESCGRTRSPSFRRRSPSWSSRTATASFSRTCRSRSRARSIA